MPEEEESDSNAASRHALAETWQHALPNTRTHMPRHGRMLTRTLQRHGNRHGGDDMPKTCQPCHKVCITALAKDIATVG
jgi:hypothetical protein